MKKVIVRHALTLGSALCLVAACSSEGTEIGQRQDPVQFPAEDQWHPLLHAGVVLGDEALDVDVPGLDLVGSDTSAAVSIHLGDAHLFVRLRLDGSPLLDAGHLLPHGWGVVLDPGGLDLHLVADGVHGTLGDEALVLGGNAQVTLADSTFNGTGDFFLDLAFPAQGLPTTHLLRILGGTSHGGELLDLDRTELCDAHTLGDTVHSVLHAVGDVLTVDEDHSIVDLDILGNDHLLALGLVTISVTQPEHGLVKVNLDGTLSIRVDLDFHGDLDFAYTLTDVLGHVTTAPVHIHILSIDDLPEAVDDIVHVTATGSAIHVDVLGNDHGLGDGPIQILADASAQAEVLVDVAGRLQVLPPSGFTGPLLVPYTILDADGDVSTAVLRLLVTAGIDTPVEDVDTEVFLGSGCPGHIDLSAQLGLDHSHIGVEVVQPIGAYVKVVGDGALDVTAEVDFTGLVIFAYVVVDLETLDVLHGLVTLQIGPDKDCDGVPDEEDEDHCGCTPTDPEQP